MELTVATLISTGVIATALVMLQSTTRTADTQRELADIQQSLRIAQNEITRHIRMAGRGGLAGSSASSMHAWRTAAVSVRDHRHQPSELPGIEVETDVLTVRGVFNSPVYSLSRSEGGATVQLFDGFGAVTEDRTSATSGLLIVENLDLNGRTQDLAPLIDAIEDDLPEALVMSGGGAPQCTAIVQLDPASSRVEHEEDRTTVKIRILLRDGRFTDAYRALSGAAAQAPCNSASVGILEERHFYVRRIESAGGVRRALALARMYPGTGTPYRDRASETRVDLADDISNLQVALGFVVGGPHALQSRDLVVRETSDGSDDDWLFNGLEDDPDTEPWTRADTSAPDLPVIRYVRFSLWVEGNRRPGRTGSASIAENFRVEQPVPDGSRSAVRFLRSVVAPRSTP